jgi:N-acetyl-anhydromuramyl-L-alanine amidase AmpD
MAYPFIKARYFTPGRSNPIDLLVIHTMESPEGADTAENVAKWFAGPTSNKASAHYCIDSDTIIQAVKDDDVAWHAPGANYDGLGFEHAGRASQGGGEWGDDYSKAMLKLSAKLVAEKCKQYDIPPVWLYPADLRAGRRGITSHANVSEAFHRSDHTDPGRGFPIQRYLRLVREALGTPTATNEKVLKDDPPTVREGDKGWLVKRLQRLLDAKGFDPGTIDGIFGNRTEEALKRFQREQDLEADAIAGPLTWKALLAKE